MVRGSEHVVLESRLRLMLLTMMMLQGSYEQSSHVIFVNSIHLI